MSRKPNSGPHNRIKELREARGLTQVRLAELVGMSSQNLGRIEAGGVGLRETHIPTFAEQLGVPPGDLFEDDAPSPTLRSVPLIAWVSAGGMAHAATSMLREVPMIQMDGLDAGEYFATQVRGDSMDRLSPDGSVVVVNRADRRLVAGKPYIFAFRGETTYKLWFSDPDQLAPFSTNPTHRPTFPKRESDWEVVGRVRRSVLDIA